MPAHMMGTGVEASSTDWVSSGTRTTSYSTMGNGSAGSHTGMVRFTISGVSLNSKGSFSREEPKGLASTGPTTSMPDEHLLSKTIELIC